MQITLIGPVISETKLTQIRVDKKKLYSLVKIIVKTSSKINLFAEDQRDQLSLREKILSTRLYIHCKLACRCSLKKKHLIFSLSLLPLHLLKYYPRRYRYIATSKNGTRRRKLARGLERWKATRRALIVADEASSPAVAFSSKCPRCPVDDERDVPRNQNNTPLVSRPPLAFFSPPHISISFSSLHLILLRLLSPWVIRSHRQKALAVRRLRSTSAVSNVHLAVLSSAQVCNKDVTWAPRDTPGDRSRDRLHSLLRSFARGSSIELSRKSHGPRENHGDP